MRRHATYWPSSRASRPRRQRGRQGIWGMDCGVRREEETRDTDTEQRQRRGESSAELCRAVSHRIASHHTAEPCKRATANIRAHARRSTPPLRARLVSLSPSSIRRKAARVKESRVPGKMPPLVYRRLLTLKERGTICPSSGPQRSTQQLARLSKAPARAQLLCLGVAL